MIMAMQVNPLDDKNSDAPDMTNLQPSGTLPGLGAMMEVAGIESIPGAQVKPKMVGYSRVES